MNERSLKKRMRHMSLKKGGGVDAKSLKRDYEDHERDEGRRSWGARGERDSGNG